MKRTEWDKKYPDEFTHDGIKYNLRIVQEACYKLPRQLFKISELDWLIPFVGWTEEDEKRYPNFNRPIFVVWWQGKKCCVDGYHRIVKGKRQGRTRLVGVWVPDAIMEAARIEDDL